MLRTLILVVTVGLAAALFMAGRSWPSQRGAYSVPNASSVVSRELPMGIQERLAYTTLLETMRETYVDELPSELKIVANSVKGMINVLGDSNSMFFDPAAFSAFEKAQSGQLEGVGVRLSPIVDQGSGVNPTAAKPTAGTTASPEEVLATVPRVQRLVVTAVAPDGSAAQSGVKVGDILYSINGRWMVNTDLLIRFRKAQRDFEAKKIPLSQLNALRKELRDKIDRAMLPSRGLDALTVGTTGTVDVVWDRGTTKRETKLARGVSQLPLTKFAEGVLSWNATPESVEKVPSSGIHTIDLRNGVEGNEKVLEEMLAKLGPAGNLGQLKRSEGRGPLKLKGGTNATKYRLLVDRSTRGAAQVLARALVRAGVGTLEGKMDDASVLNDVVKLPEGSGYSLAVAKWEAGK